MIDIMTNILYFKYIGDELGFDCDSGVLAACRVCCQLVKNGRLIIIANDNFALAA